MSRAPILGQSLSRQPRVDLPATGQIITTMSENFSLSRTVHASKAASSAGQVWAGTGFPLAMPFWMPRPFSVLQLGWVNGSGTLSDNGDLGVYDSAFSKQISTGSVARSGGSTWQWTDVADTPLSAGKYFLTYASNGTTAANISGWAATASTMALLGVKDKASGDFALPSTLASMVDSATFVITPLVGIAYRTLA